MISGKSLLIILGNKTLIIEIAPPAKIVPKIKSSVFPTPLKITPTTSTIMTKSIIFSMPSFSESLGANGAKIPKHNMGKVVTNVTSPPERCKELLISGINVPKLGKIVLKLKAISIKPKAHKNIDFVSFEVSLISIDTPPCIY